MSTHAHPTLDDPVVAALSEGVGGPVGTRAGRSRWWTPTSVVLLLAAATFALGMLAKAPCADSAWTDGQTRYALMCYSDVPYVYTRQGLVEREWPYTADPQVRDRFEPLALPVAVGYYAWTAGWLTHAVLGLPDLGERYRVPADELVAQPEVRHEVRVFVAVNAVGLALLALLAAWFLTRVEPTRPWDATILAASPLLALTGLIGWDLLGVALVAASVWAWSRGRSLLAGALVGCAAAAAVYPVLLLAAMGLVAARRGRRALGATGVATVAALAAWSLVNVPAYLSSPGAWRATWAARVDQGAGLGSAWQVAEQVLDRDVAAGTVDAAVAVLLGGWCLAVALLTLLAARPPRLAQVGFLLVAGWLLVAPGYAPQHVLWLLPLAALARPRWRDQLVWQAGELFYFAVVWWYLGGYLRPGGAADDGSYDAPVYWLAVALRLLGELYLVAVVARDVLRPDHDPVDPGRGGQDTSVRSNVVVV